MCISFFFFFFLFQPVWVHGIKWQKGAAISGVWWFHPSKFHFPHLQHDGWGVTGPTLWAVVSILCGCLLVSSSKHLRKASYYYDYDSWLRTVFSFKDWDRSPWKTGISMSFLLVWVTGLMREQNREPLSASGWAPEPVGVESSGTLTDLMWWSCWWGASLHLSSLSAWLLSTQSHAASPGECAWCAT